MLNAQWYMNTIEKLLNRKMTVHVFPTYKRYLQWSSKIHQYKSLSTYIYKIFIPTQSLCTRNRKLTLNIFSSVGKGNISGSVKKNIIPIPMPTMMRPTRRVTFSGAAPITMAPTRNTRLAHRITGRRPKRSERSSLMDILQPNATYTKINICNDNSDTLLQNLNFNKLI